jgi:hypothetical protein
LTIADFLKEEIRKSKLGNRPRAIAASFEFPGTAMPMTREKVIQLSHQIMSAIEELDEMEIFEEPNVIRQEIVKILSDLQLEEQKIDTTVRQHITSQKRTIPEGGAEWDILYKKYYFDELRKLGITFPTRS